MPLYLVAFAEHGGYRYQCRLRAAAVADHIDLAVKKIWGVAACWVWCAGSDEAGRVYEQVGDPEAPTQVPRTAQTTVQITPAHRRPRVPERVQRETLHNRVSFHGSTGDSHKVFNVRKAL